MRFGQRIVSTIFTQSSQERVIMEADPQTLRTPEALSSLYFGTATGGATQLSTMATVEQRLAPLQVNHVGQFPAANLAFDTAPGVALGSAVDRSRRPKNRSACRPRSPPPSSAPRTPSNPRSATSSG